MQTRNLLLALPLLLVTPVVNAQESPTVLVRKDRDKLQLKFDLPNAIPHSEIPKLQDINNYKLYEKVKSEDLATNASKGVVNRVSDVKLLQGDLAEAWREGGDEYATVAMRYQQVDKTLDRATGKVLEGDDKPDEGVEYWTFRRPQGGPWMVSAIQQTN